MKANRLKVLERKQRKIGLPSYYMKVARVPDKGFRVYSKIVPHFKGINMVYGKLVRSITGDVRRVPTTERKYVEV